MNSVLSVIVGVVVLCFGVLFLTGRALPLFRSWRQMPEQEKAGIRVDRLNRNLGAVIIICGLIFLICGVMPDVPGTTFSIAMVVWIALAIADAVFISKSKRYVNVAPSAKGKSREEDEEKAKAVESAIKGLLR